MIKIGIYGASGYMGSEALRVLLKHPDVSVEWATSRSDTPVEFYHKNFYGRGVRFIKPESPLLFGLTVNPIKNVDNPIKP